MHCVRRGGRRVKEKGETWYSASIEEVVSGVAWVAEGNLSVNN